MTRATPKSSVSLPVMHPAFLQAAGVLLIALGAWTLPLQYLTGFVSTMYPTEVKLLLGTWAIASGIGVLMRASWGRWLGVAFALTQLASVATAGFRYEAVMSLGLTVRVRWLGQPIELQVNFLALALLVVLLAARAGRAPAPHRIAPRAPAA